MLMLMVLVLVEVKLFPIAQQCLTWSHSASRVEDQGPASFRNPRTLEAVCMLLLALT